MAVNYSSEEEQEGAREVAAISGLPLGSFNVKRVRVVRSWQEPTPYPVLSEEASNGTCAEPGTDSAYSCEVQDGIKACTEASATVIAMAAEGAKAQEAERTGFIKFLGAALRLDDVLDENMREELVRQRGGSLNTGPLNNRFLPFLKALFSEDPGVRKRYAGKLTQWAQVARGMLEGCGVEPEGAEEFLTNGRDGISGRTLALRAHDELPEVKAKRAEARDRQAEKKAAETSPADDEQARRPEPEQALRRLAEFSEDDLGFVEAGMLRRSVVDILACVARPAGLTIQWGERQVPVTDCRVVPTEHGCAIIFDGDAVAE